MRIMFKLIKLVAVAILLVIAFNKIAPFLLADEKSGLEGREEVSTPPQTEFTPVETLKLHDDEVEISARLVEEGRWIILIDDSEHIFAHAFQESGMLTERPEFDLYIRTKLIKRMPELDFEETLIKIDGCCQGEYELHVRGRDVVVSIFDILNDLYSSKDDFIADVADFKLEVKTCMASKDISSFVCKQLEENPLPKPEPLILYVNDDGENVPLKGFSECYFRKMDKYKRKTTEEEKDAVKEACYSEW